MCALSYSGRGVVANGGLGDYRPEVSLEPSKLSLSSNLFSPQKLLMTGDDYLFRFKLALFYEAHLLP